MSLSAWRRRPPDAYWAQGDTAPAVAEQLFDGTGTAVVLTGATVKFQARFFGSTSVKVDATATITDAATGKVSYTPISADTDTPGDLMVQWKVTFSGGAVERFANGSLQKIEVTKQVAA